MPVRTQGCQPCRAGSIPVESVDVGNAVLPEEVVYGVASIDPAYEFRDEDNKVIDYKEFEVWEDYYGSRFYFTSTRFGRRPVFMHCVGNMIPAWFSFADGRETRQHPDLHLFWNWLMYKEGIETMTFREALVAKLTDARKNKNSLQMGLLQLIIGEAQMQEGKGSGKVLTDEQIEAIVRKTAKTGCTSMAMVALGEGATDEAVAEAATKIGEGNQELLAVVRAKNPDYLEKATNEDAFLMSLLPKTLTVEEIKAALAETVADLKAAKNEGASIGVAMKVIKAKNLKALGENVKKAVQELRA